MKEDLTQWASGLLWASESRPGSAGEDCGRPCLEAASPLQRIREAVICINA